MRMLDVAWWPLALIEGFMVLIVLGIIAIVVFFIVRIIKRDKKMAGKDIAPATAEAPSQAEKKE